MSECVHRKTERAILRRQKPINQPADVVFTPAGKYLLLIIRSVGLTTVPDCSRLCLDAPRRRIVHPNHQLVAELVVETLTAVKGWAVNTFFSKFNTDETGLYCCLGIVSTVAHDAGSVSSAVQPSRHAVQHATSLRNRSSRSQQGHSLVSADAL